MRDLWRSHFQTTSKSQSIEDGRFWEPPKRDCTVIVRFFTFQHTITDTDVQLDRVQAARVGQTGDFFYCPYRVTPGKRTVLPFGADAPGDSKLRPLDKYAVCVHVAGQDGLKIWEAGKTVVKRLLDIVESPDYQDQECFNQGGLDFFLMVSMSGSAIDRYSLLPRSRDKARTITDVPQVYDLWDMPEFMPSETYRPQAPARTMVPDPVGTTMTMLGSTPPPSIHDTSAALRPGLIVRMLTPEGGQLSGQVSDGPDDEGLYTVIAEDSSIWTVKPDEVTVVER